METLAKIAWSRGGNAFGIAQTSPPAFSNAPKSSRRVYMLSREVNDGFTARGSHSCMDGVNLVKWDEPFKRKYMNPFHAACSVAVFLGLALLARAETVKDRDAAVRGDKVAMEQNTRWLYNDIDQGFAEARRTGKPLMVVLRCVPCLACMGIDSAVLTSRELNPLLDQFVRVRVINANDLDLARFQFDYDLSFSTLYFNGDGTLYGRFGSWRHQKNSQESDLASYRRSLEAALEIHRGYPANRERLAGKQGQPMPFRSPLEIPGLAGKYQRTLDWRGKVVASCLHCHQIGDAIRTLHRERDGTIPPEWVYPQPAPETVGLRLAPDQVATVDQVVAGSAAERAGFRKGDRITAFAGQPPVSVADICWVLHRAPETGSLEVVVEREGRSESLHLQLPADWRYQSDISSRVGTWGMRAMAFGGLQLIDLSDQQRRERGLESTGMALLVLHAGEYDTHAAAKKAGFQKGDVLLEVGDRKERLSESALLGRLLHDHRPGTRLETTVLRGEERLRLQLPIQ